MGDAAQVMIMLTEADLRRIVSETVRAELAQNTNARKPRADKLTPAQVASELGCTPRHVHNLLDQGLPHQRLGRHVRIDRAELDAWRAAKQVEEDAKRKSKKKG
jgi:excisionase family DNA binding protein